MSGTDLEHRAEIRRANRTTPIWIGLVVVAAIVALVVGSGDDGGEAAPDPGPTTAPATPTSETLTTTSPRGLPPVYGLTETHRGLLAFSTAVAPSSDTASAEPTVFEVADGPIVTDGRAVVLDADRMLHVGQPGTAFRPGTWGWEEIHPSNEPGHVWGRWEDEVALLDLDRIHAEPSVVLLVGDGEVLGPASFGVVVLGADGTTRWHRPSFEPTVVPLPPDRRAIDSGGERLLVAAPATAAAGARLEVWSITGNGLLSTYALVDGAGADGRLSPDGTLVLVPSPGGWDVRDAVTGVLHGTLPKGASPVWVGGNRFGAAIDGQLVVSDRGVLPLRWPVLAVAEQSP